MTLLHKSLLSLVLLTAVLLGQGSVSGTLTNAVTGEPIAQGNIVVKGSSRGDAADHSGYYAIQGLSVGEHTLIFSAMGFEPIERVVIVSPSAVTLDISLQPVILQAPVLLVIRERISLIGDPSNIFTIPGAAHVISKVELRKHSYSNIHRVLQQVPGVNVQEEDGFGLRPNIGMRGTGVERSQKIALMEDGVLIAPAPYAAPAAYYFPRVGRMESVEVRKGSSQIKYGPNTNGGALNLISTSLPSRFTTHLDLSTGDYNARRAHLYAGASGDRVGWLLETFQHANDGFKVLDRGGKTGFAIADFLAKVRLNNGKGTGILPFLELKLGYTDEVSHETYLGLTDSVFSRQPYRRYAASGKDRLDAQHAQVGLTHFTMLGATADVTTTLYRNAFKRNWYKLDRVGGLKIADILADPGRYVEQVGLLSAADSDPDQYQVKANKRRYYAQGIQTFITLKSPLGRVTHQLEAGLRYHEDMEDRFQHVDKYQMVAGGLQLSAPGVPGSGGRNNVISTATARALFIQDKISLNLMTITTGLRYESISFYRQDYGADDPQRTGTDLTSHATSVRALIPGVGIDYRLSSELSLFGGVHKGFSPPGPGAGEQTRAEESVNTELGLRYRRAALGLLGTAFHSRYDNLLGSDLSAVGGDGTGEQFNGGEANIDGLETVVRYAFRYAGFALSAKVNYTLTRAHFVNEYVSDFKPWGNIQAGDELPYLPRHQLAASIGAERISGALYLNGRYVSPMRTQAGQGSIEKSASTDASLLFDLTAQVNVAPNAGLYFKVTNLTNQTYVVARRPAGVRPGLPRTVSAGIRVDF